MTSQRMAVRERVLQLGSQRWLLLRWNEAEPGWKGQRFHDVHAAVHWLQILQGNVASSAVLRRCAAREVDAWQLTRMSDDEVIRYFAGLLSGDVYCVYALHERSPCPYQPVRLSGSDIALSKGAESGRSQSVSVRPKLPLPRAPARVEIPASALSTPARAALPVLHPQTLPAATQSTVVTSFWVEIELLGEDDSPVAAEPYSIVLPDGSLRSGLLDAQGRAKVEGIADPGICRVSFPRLDRDAWSELSVVSSQPLETGRSHAQANATLV